MRDIGLDPAALLVPLGITRLANQTGLDVVGIPVFAAFRPNSRSVAVHQGKGVDRDAARISAVMEAAECFAAETCDLPLRLARAVELPGAADPLLLPRAPGAPDPSAQRLLWVEGADLLSGRACWVPHELVHADYTAPQPPGSGLFQATTNGMGAGLGAAQAQLHALCEAVERDAVALWHAAGGPAGRDARVVALDTVEDAACCELLRRIAAHGIRVVAWDVTADTGLAVCVALLMPPDEGLAGIEPELGTGCHPRPATALLRALLEAAQARVTRIAGARDDFDPHTYGPTARAARLAQASAWSAQAATSTAGRLPPSAPPASYSRDLEVVLLHLGRVVPGPVAWVDLGRPELPIAVGRAVVPGLEGPYAGSGDTAPGLRARATAR